MTGLADQNDYTISYIFQTYSPGQQKAVQAINSNLLNPYWKIGLHIIEFEQNGAERATYGTRLLPVLAKDLSLLRGKGFSLTNLKLMRQFYTAYPKSQAVSDQLRWSHFVELLNKPEHRLYFWTEGLADWDLCFADPKTVIL